MEEYYDEPQLRRHRRKKLRISRVVFFLLFLCIFAFSIYAIIQFQIGKAMTIDEKMEEESFAGDLVNLNGPSFENYLLLGIDQKDDNGKARTDTMMVVSLNKEEKTIRVISFMRDIYAEIPGYKSYKLNTAYYLGGVQTAKDTLSTMFHVPIHHYALIDFDNFEAFIDIAFPKGIEIDVQKEMSEKIGVTLQAGKKRLSGEELLGYARFRADAEGDFGRVTRQQEVIAAIKSEGKELSTLFNLPKMMGALSNLVESDLSNKDQLFLLASLVSFKDLQIETMTVPVEGSYSFTSYEHAGAVIEVDLEKNRQAIVSFLNNSN